MKGIINIGNSCYINSALQLLFNCDDFRLLCKYDSDLMKNINMYDTLNKFNPSEIKHIVAKNNKIFANYSQQDSFEFIVYLLDYIDNINKTGISKEVHNLLYDKFGLQTNINIKCKMSNCLKESEHIENDLFLQLSLPNNINDLSDLYRYYKKQERLENDTAYNCENCKKKTVGRKRTTTSKWSNNLIIVLKRFDYMMRKNNKPINIPLEWRHNYKLKGAVIHSGDTDGGHYIYFGNENNNWYVANDSNISKINDINDFMKSNGCYSYILLYCK